MFRNIVLLAALAMLGTFSICSSDKISDAGAFIKEIRPTLDSLQEQFRTVSENLVNYPSLGLDKKEEVITKLDEGGKTLRKIAKSASDINLDSVDDVEVRQAIIQLRNLEERLKLGGDIVQLGLDLKSLLNSYEEDDIESYDDSDYTFSLKDIEESDIVTRTEDIKEINYYWEKVSERVNQIAATPFLEFVQLVQKHAAKYNISASQFLFPNLSDGTMAELENVMQELMPFYKEVHTYLRQKLLRRYGVGVIKPNKPIPETLFLQVEDRIWTRNHFQNDFPREKLPALLEMLIEREINAKKLVELAEEFYNSLGFDGLMESFWKENIYPENDESDEECVANVKDIYYNITLQYCDDVDVEHLLNYHEYFGRIHSAVLKKDLPLMFYGGNSFGRAVGKAVRMAVHTPKHISMLKLLPEKGMNKDATLNTNVRLAIETLFSLARQYVGIRLITEVLDGKTIPEDINDKYWELFKEYGGVDPPIARSEESMDLPYSLITSVMKNENIVRDFEETVLSYDIYRAACQRTGHTGSLHDCDFYNDKSVGESLKKILAVGTSKPADKALEPLLPSYKKLSAEALLAYFEPAHSWVKEYNEKHNITSGWEISSKKLSEKPLTSEDDAAVFIERASSKIYELYDQIAEDLFRSKNLDAEFEDSTYGNIFWKISKSALAADELRQISLKARQFDAQKFLSKNNKRAINKLIRIADVFVLGEDLESYISYKQQLFNTSIDDDITKYKDKSDDPVTVAYNPFILDVFRTSNDSAELKYYWEAWREKNGAFAKSVLKEIITYLEKAAEILEISKTELWFKHYNNHFIDKMEEVIENIKPLYLNLHNYVRERLVTKYSFDEFSWVKGAIPDHLVQQVLLQIWTNESIVESDFPWNKLPPNDNAVQQKKYTALQLLKVAEEFYQSLGFKPIEESFWSERLQAKDQSSNDKICHAELYDMTPKVYLKYCEHVSYRKLLQAHGYMGRINYAVEKKDLPSYYFNSYDFEYPVGEAVILSASSPKHSQKMGLIPDFEITDQTLLNRLIRMGIHTLFNLHKYFVHTKVVDEYLKGEIKEDEITKYYWKYMIDYAGIEPPDDRRVGDFDFPFEFYTDLEQNHQVKKFVSEVLGYSFYEYLCKISEHKGDLNNCDFFGNIEVGNALKKMMHLGSSRPQNTVLKQLGQSITGMNGESLLNYYKPLADWLEKTLDETESDFDSYRKFLRSEYFT